MIQGLNVSMYQIFINSYFKFEHGIFIIILAHWKIEVEN